MRASIQGRWWEYYIYACMHSCQTDNFVCARPHTRSAPAIQDAPVTSAITEPTPGTVMPKGASSVTGGWGLIWWVSGEWVVCVEAVVHTDNVGLLLPQRCAVQDGQSQQH